MANTFPLETGAQTLNSCWRGLFLPTPLDLAPVKKHILILRYSLQQRYRITVKCSNKFSSSTHCDFPLALAIAAALKLLHHWQLLLLRLLLGHWQDVQLLVRGRRFFCHPETLAVTLQFLPFEIFAVEQSLTQYFGSSPDIPVRLLDIHNGKRLVIENWQVYV